MIVYHTDQLVNMFRRYENQLFSLVGDDGVLAEILEEDETVLDGGRPSVRWHAMEAEKATMGPEVGPQKYKDCEITYSETTDRVFLWKYKSEDLTEPFARLVLAAHTLLMESNR